MINKRPNRIIFCLIFVWLFHVTSSFEQPLFLSNVLSPSSKIQDQGEKNTITSFKYLDRGWSESNGELLLYKGQGVLLAGRSYVGKSSLAYVAHENPDWKVVSLAPTYFRLAISKINKVLLIGKKTNRKGPSIASRIFGAKEVEVITEDSVIVRWLVMFDDYTFPEELKIWKAGNWTSAEANVSFENLDVRHIRVNVREHPATREGCEALLERISQQIDYALEPNDSMLQVAL